MSDCWYPIDHRYTGECSPPARLVAPHYPTMPDFIRVYDTVVRTAGWRRSERRLWRDVRTKALTRWGYPFRVLERGLVRGDYLPNGITLDVQAIGTSSNNYGGFGLAPIDNPSSSDYDEATWNDAKGFVLMHPTTVANAFAARVGGYLTGAMCHEFGHALGFGHGGTGIMRSALLPPYYPNAEDLAALRAYWGEA